MPLPLQLTEDQLRELRRKRIWFGDQTANDLKQSMIAEHDAGVREQGLSAIENIRSRGSQDSIPQNPQFSQASQNLGELTDLVQKSTPEEQERARGSVTLNNYVKDLQSQNNQASRPAQASQPTDYRSIVEDEVYSKGLGDNPDVQNFLKFRQGTQKAELESQKLQSEQDKLTAFQKGISAMTEGLPEEEKNNIATKMMNVFAESGLVDQASKIGTSQFADIGKMDFEYNRKGEAETQKAGFGQDLQKLRQEGVMEGKRFDRGTKIMMADKAAQAAKDKDKDDKTKIKGLKDLPAQAKNRLTDFAAGHRLLVELSKGLFSGDLLGVENIGKSAPSKVPFFGEKLSGYATPDVAVFNNAKKQVAEVFLRAATGAQANDTEVELYANFLPSVGDSKEIAKAKMKTFAENVKARARATTDLLRFTGEDATAKFIEDRMASFFVMPEIKDGEGKTTNTQPAQSKASPTANQKVMEDASGNKALVEVDENGNPIRVIKEL